MHGRPPVSLCGSLESRLEEGELHRQLLVLGERKEQERVEELRVLGQIRGHVVDEIADLSKICKQLSDDIDHWIFVGV